MQNNNKNVCRLCLKVVHGTHAGLINEVTRKMLDVLLIKLDLDVRGDPLMCRMCSDILDEIYMFKSKCLYSEDIISDHFDRNFKVNLRDILIEIQNKPDVIIAEDEAICRLCIKIPCNDNYISLNKTDVGLGFSRDMMQIHLLPEINLSITEEPIVCEECHVLLKNYTAFVNNCADVERKIKLYRNHQDTSGKKPVDLNCVLHFIKRNLNKNFMITQEEGSISVKLEQFEAEENNLSNDHYVGGSNTEYTKNEEANLKYKGDGVRVKSSESKDCKSQEGKCKLEDNKAVDCESNLNEELIIKQEEDAVNVEQLEDEENNVSGDQAGIMIEDQRLSCDQCTYSTNFRPKLLKHKQIHDKDSERQMCECILCSLQAKDGFSIKSYKAKTHRSPNQKFTNNLYSCDKCTYFTNFRVNLHRHKRIHQRDSEKKKCQCILCSLQAKRQAPRSAECFKSKTISYRCNKCTYSTKFATSLHRHKKIHQKDIERQMYKCTLCGFQAKKSVTVECHKVEMHRDPSMPVLKCPHCPYVTALRRLLEAHMRQQHSTKDTKESKKNYTRHFTDEDMTLECDKCKFQTSNVSHLLNHMKQHDPSEQPMLKCDQCDYCTRDKGSLDQHQLTHMVVQ